MFENSSIIHKPKERLDIIFNAGFLPISYNASVIYHETSKDIFGLKITQKIGKAVQ